MIYSSFKVIFSAIPFLLELLKDRRRENHRKQRSKTPALIAIVIVVNVLIFYRYLTHVDTLTQEIHATNKSLATIESRLESRTEIIKEQKERYSQLKDELSAARIALKKMRANNNTLAETNEVLIKENDLKDRHALVQQKEIVQLREEINDRNHSIEVMRMRAIDTIQMAYDRLRGREQ
ncbi:hypothetical protein [Endozoicomonas sp. ONNA1]|uniref:hypothetical protein n=1 Tax=Endozoicomonas sp. ONNA1 TaxID=2828740 RepID=UPI0021483A02|nr:hypothetical protein [Endozoicomonas sp. ONNA1]